MLLDLFMRRLIRIGTLTLRYPDGSLRRYGGGPGPVAGMALRMPAAGSAQLTFNVSTARRARHHRSASTATAPGRR